MADVTVEFGAKIDQLIAGVDQVKSKLGEITAAADSMGAGFDRLKDIILAAFSIDGITRYIESMAALGLSVERNMAILGASANEVIQLSGVAQLVGQDMDTLSIQLNRLTLNVQKSTRDGFNPQAQSLKLLGINAQQFIAMPFEDKVNAIQAAVSKFNPSLNLTNVLTEIGGRGFASQLPLLTKSKEQWDEMQAAVARARDGLAYAIPGMADTHEKLTLMSESVQSLGARIFTVLKPAIDWAVTAFTNFAQGINYETIRNALVSIITSTNAFLTSLVNIAESLGEIFDQVANKIRGVVSPLIILNAITDTLAAALKTAVDASMRALGYALDATKPKIDAEANAFSALRDKIAEASAAMIQFANQSAFVGPLTGGAKRPEIGAINFGAAKASADALKVINDAYNEEALRIKETYGNFIFTENAKTQDLIANLDKRYAAEIAAGEKTSIAQARYALDLQKIHSQATKDYEKDLNEMFSGLEGAINGQLRGILSGTVSFAQGVKNIFADMVIKVIEEIEKLAFKWLAHELAMTLATETGTAARTTSEAAGATAAEGMQIGKALASIFRSAGETFAGVFAFLSPVMGPAAAGPAAASEATVLGVGMGIAGAAVGTDYVARTGLAVIHQGEAVVPAQFNTPFTGGGGSSQQVNLTVQAVDARSFANLLNSNPGLIANLIKRSMRDGQLNLSPAR